MKHLLLTFIFSALSISCFSQLEESAQIRATLIPIGLDTEFAIADNYSINVDAGLQPSGYIYITKTAGGSSSSDSYFGLNPFAQVSARNYYNFDKRLDKGKKISGNSGNYLGLHTSYSAKPVISTSDDYDDYTSFSTGLVWGIQRTYDSNIYLDFNTGLGYVSTNGGPDDVQNIDGLGFVGSFALGYAFGQ